MTKRTVLSIFFVFLLALSLTSCTHSSNLNSIEQLLEHDEIISYEAIEVDADYLDFLEQYCNEERDQWYDHLGLSNIESIKKN